MADSGILAGWLFPFGTLAIWCAGIAAGLVAAALGRRPAAPTFRSAAYLLGAAGGATAAVGAAAAALAGAAGPLADSRTAGAAGAAGIFGTTDGQANAGLTALALTVDPLGAYFALALGVIAFAVCIYGLGYRPGHGEAEGNRVVAAGLLTAGCNGFLAAMLLVFLAGNVFTFLLAWEAMSLLSFFLVLYDHETVTVRRAGYIYLVMTHAGTAFLLGAFLLLAGHAGSFDFAGIRDALGAGSSGSSSWRAAVFLLALVGFGTKAGMIPLHVWLPRAHPAAPTHVSALMSGVMVKTGIYGLLRVAWDLLGLGSLGTASAAGAGTGLVAALPAGVSVAPWQSWAWAGCIVLAAGVVSAVVGVLHAVAERDLKKLLAYSTVENVGIILIGLGASLLFGVAGLPALGAVALGAALLHTLNHAVFKSLLFLGAGAVLQGAHTRDLQEMGGLIRRMPWTAAAFLLGAVAIAGLPPLNGFVSEWLTLQSLVALAARTRGLPGGLWLGVGPLAAAALLGLAAALAAAAMLKAFAGAFLALPRHHHASSAHEVPASMRWGMGTLAAACIGLALFPGVPLLAVAQVTAQVIGTIPAASAALLPDASMTAIVVEVSPAGAAAPLVPLGLIATLAAAAWLGAGLRRWLGSTARVRRAPTWACGIRLEPEMEYTPQSYSKSLRMIFSWALQPFREAEPEFAVGGAPYFLRAMRFRTGTRPVIEHAVYARIENGLVRAAQHLRRLQTGSLRLYLAYLLGALVVLLVWGR